jgi:hypothetical protein
MGNCLCTLHIHTYCMLQLDKAINMINTAEVKVKLSCALTEHHVIKVYWGNIGIASLIL